MVCLICEAGVSFRSEKNRSVVFAVHGVTYDYKERVRVESAAVCSKGRVGVEREPWKVSIEQYISMPRIIVIIGINILSASCLYYFLFLGWLY